MPSEHRKQILILLCLLFIALFPVMAQDDQAALPIREDSLLKQYEVVLGKNPFQRVPLADSFYHAFTNALLLEGSFTYPFDKLEKIGKIYSGDERLRIFTWNIPINYGDNLYFGLVQYYSKNDKQYRIVKLNLPVSTGNKGMKKDWQGALYYAIVDTKHAGQRYYTLLGYDLNNPLSNIKMIDVVTVDDFDEFYFAENLISVDGKKQSRLSFEYNEKATMSLNYNEKAKMIVFDHLSPSKPSLENQYEFYGPDFTYDGLKWEKGTWVFYSNIDVTN